MKSIKPPFTYPVVKDESTTENGRVYFLRHEGVEYNPLYSVTTIISRMSNVKDAVEEWKNLIGHDRANQIISKSTNIGDRMHDILHYRISQTPNYQDKFKKNFLFQIANKLADNIQTNYLESNLDEIWGSETPLFIPELYAGRADLIGVYKGKPSIIDFKNSYKDKKEEHMDNYFLQSAAYAIAHNYLFKTDIQQFVILFGNSTDFSVQERVIEGEEFNYWKDRWLNILKDFFE